MAKSSKPKPKATPIRASFFIPAEDYAAAKKMAAREKSSISAFITKCVRLALR
jgi:hypothetical protein